MNKLKNTKKGILILSILLLFLVIGAASAADDKISEDDLSAPTDSVDEVASVDNDDEVSTAETTSSVLGSSDANSTLKATSNEDTLKEDEPSFSDLNYLIKVTDGELILTSDYKYNTGSDTELVISKNNFILNGNGHTIDANNNVRPFTVTGNNVTIKNLHIIHSGNAALWSGHDGKLINTTYTDANVQNVMPGIQFSGDNAYIYGCTFNNINRNTPNAAADVSDILTFSGVNIHVENTLFSNSYTHGRSVIVVLGSCGGDNIFKNCTFDNLTTYIHFVVFVRGVSSSFYDCKFLNCSGPASQSIYSTGTLSVYDTLFEDIDPKKLSADSSASVDIVGDPAYLLQNCTFKNYLGSTANCRVMSQQIFNCNFINVPGIRFYNLNVPLSLVVNSTFSQLQTPFCSDIAIPVRIYNSTFKDNEINDNYLINLNSASGNILNNVTFINNTANSALINIDNGITVNINDLKFIDTRAPENITNNGESFIPRTIIYVSDTPTGDGSSRTLTTTLDNALSIVDTGGTIIIINGTHTIDTINTDCDITGEDNVLINARYVVMSKFRTFKNIDFNQTVQFDISSYSTLINSTFTNLSPTPFSTDAARRANGFFYVYGADYYNFNNVTIKDSDFNNRRVFGFWNSNSQSTVLSFNCNNLTIDNVKRLNYVVYEECLANSHFTDITITNTTFAGLLSTGTGLSNTMSSFNHVTVRDCNITDYFIYTQNTANCGVVSFNDFVVDNINFTPAKSFIALRYNQVIDGGIISNIYYKNALTTAIFQLNGVNSNNRVKNIEVYNVYDFRDVIDSPDDDEVDNVYIHDINSEYAVGQLNSQNAVIRGLKVKDCNFTLFAVCLGKNAVMSNSEFDNINASIYVYDSSVKIDTCTFNNMNPVNGSVLINGEYCFILNSEFNGNIARDCAGAIFINSNGSQILNTKFTDNNATNYGGAVFVSHDIYYYMDELSTALNEENEYIHPLIDGIYRIGYIPTYDIIYIDPNIVDHNENRSDFKKALTLINPNGKIISLYGNDTYTYDLSNYVFAKSNVTIIGYNTTLIMKNVLSIDEYASDFCISNYNFVNAPERVFLWEGENGKIINCTFKDNINTMEDAYGSVIDIEADHLSIINSSFIGNHMEGAVIVGGLVYFNATGLVMDNCSFIDNKASTANCIYLTVDSRDVLINQTKFIGNGAFTTAAVSGCVLVEAYNVNFNECEFINNTIGGDASCIMLNSVGGLVRVDDCLFVNNSASNGGAVMILLCPDLILDNNTFINNSANFGSAIYNNDINLNLVNSIFILGRYDQTNNLIEGYVYSTQNVNLKNNTLSFTDLNHAVSSANSNLSLQYNYKYFKDYDSAFVGGVVVGKVLSIEGNDYLIDCSNGARAFYISANNVVVNNLTFVDGIAKTSPSSSYANGGAISVSGNDVTISYCSFDSCSADHAGAVEICGSNGHV